MVDWHMGVNKLWFLKFSSFLESRRTRRWDKRWYPQNERINARIGHKGLMRGESEYLTADSGTTQGPKILCPWKKMEFEGIWGGNDEGEDKKNYSNWLKRSYLRVAHRPWKNLMVIGWPQPRGTTKMVIVFVASTRRSQEAVAKLLTLVGNCGW